MEMQPVCVGRLSHLRPRVNFANWMSAFPGQEWGPRTIPDCQFISVISGHATLWLGGEQIGLKAGDCVFYGADTPHRLLASATQPFTFASVHFHWDAESPDPVSPIPGIKPCRWADLQQPAVPYTVMVDGIGEVQIPFVWTAPVLQPLFQEIAREYRGQAAGYAPLLRGLLTQLLAVLIRQQIDHRQGSASMRKIAPALELIHTHPHRTFTTVELARACRYHPTYFAALFKQVTGHNPKRYQILERVQRAKQLLNELDTVEEVASQLGFTDTAYFCRVFKRITGLTPSEYRKQNFEI